MRKRSQQLELSRKALNAAALDLSGLALFELEQAANDAGRSARADIFADSVAALLKEVEVQAPLGYDGTPLLKGVTRAVQRLAAAGYPKERAP